MLFLAHLRGEPIGLSVGGIAVVDKSLFLTVSRKGTQGAVHEMSLLSMEGNWDKNAIESNFRSLDHRRYVFGSYIILSNNIFHVTESDFMSLDRTLCYWIIHHSIFFCQ